MTRFKPWRDILAHLLGLACAIVLTLVTGQNPRVILYGIALGLLLRFITVWYLSNAARVGATPPQWLSRLSRGPYPAEKSKPYYKSPNNRDLAELPNYIGGIAGTMVMIATLQVMATGTEFLLPITFFTELSWGALLALVCWAEDLAGGSIILRAGEDTPTNLGYSVPALNKLLGAVAIANVLFLIGLSVVMLTDQFDRLGADLPVEWAILWFLALIRLYYEIRLP
ncbi:MAG: hypothetical protein HKN19_06855 [Halioglobus sp.]|nr:hypothetical protein [Halioglobus sp.]